MGGENDWKLRAMMIRLVWFSSAMPMTDRIDVSFSVMTNWLI
jgi:hypothetical protein